MLVLIIKTSSMGDILHTLPSLTDAIQAIPSIRFDWVVEEEFAQIPRWHTAVNCIIPVAIRRWRKAWFSTLVKKERTIFHKAISIHNYDTIIDAQGLIKSAILTYLAHGTKKHGMDWQTSKESLASLFYNCRHHIIQSQHAVERIRELFAKSLGYKKPQTNGNYAIAQNFLFTKTTRDKPYVIFIHSTTRADKLWPEVRWRELIKLMQPFNIRIKLPWYTKLEQQRAKRLAFGFAYVKVLPKLSITQIANKIAGAQAVVSVDTGLSHLTAALNQPNITLFGPTNPALVGGYGKNQYQVVSIKRQMRAITADEVFKLLKEEIT